MPETRKQGRPPGQRELTAWRLAELTARGLVSDRRERREEHGSTAVVDRPFTVRALDPRLREPVFLLGAPRSGTTFLGSCFAALPEVSYHFEPRVTKAVARHVYEGTWSEQRSARTFRATYALLQVAAGHGGRRFVEKTPENCFIVPFLRRTFPDARFVQIIRDGRDVAVSHAEKPWLAARSADSARRGRAGGAWGPWARWWVERDRVEEFAAVSDITRTAWAWRRFTEAARTHLAALDPDRVLTVRYEDVVQHPEDAAVTIAGFFGHQKPPEPLRQALLRADPRSIGRWRSALDDEARADVEREAGALLRELGYTD